jgi:hypothetical protein
LIFFFFFFFFISNVRLCTLAVSRNGKADVSLDTAATQRKAASQYGMAVPAPVTRLQHTTQQELMHLFTRRLKYELRGPRFRRISSCF